MYNSTFSSTRGTLLHYFSYDVMMPTLVGQVTGFFSTSLILFSLSKLLDSVQSSSAKSKTVGHSTFSASAGTVSV